jgi:hypothetical protein
LGYSLLQKLKKHTWIQQSLKKIDRIAYNQSENLRQVEEIQQIAIEVVL